MISQRYKWSSEVYITSLLIITLILGAIVYIMLNTEIPLVVRGCITAFLIVILAGTSIFAPRKITIDSDGIICQLLMKKATIAASDIISISHCNYKDDLKYSIRLWGSGGVFGYIGWFCNRKLGRFRMYITSREDLILVETKRGKYIFNCRISDEQIKELFSA